MKETKQCQVELITVFLFLAFRFSINKRTLVQFNFVKWNQVENKLSLKFSRDTVLKTKRSHSIIKSALRQTIQLTFLRSL